MNSRSLIVYISLFFIFLMIVINALFYAHYRYEKARVVDNAFRRFHDSRKVLHMSRKEQLPFEAAKARLENVLGIEMLDPDSHTGLYQQGRLLEQRRGATLYDVDGILYLHVRDPRWGETLLLRFEDPDLSNIRLILIAVAVDLSTALFFLYVIRRIWPLKALKEQIVAFSRGEPVRTRAQGNDEIADVANAFDEAILQIRQLQESRNLFLRNVMHELKTPIAKGKLITDLLDDEKNSRRLRDLFDRFEFLLGEFSKIERVTSNDLAMEKRRYRLVDIIDNALDLLMVDHDAIVLNLEAECEIEADYALFTIVLKNLIDNAIKYGRGRPVVIVGTNAVSIRSEGGALEETAFEKAFNRRFEDSSKGLGLGLYIVQSIVRKHGFALDYTHHDGENRFDVTFDSPTVTST